MVILLFVSYFSTFLLFRWHDFGLKDAIFLHVYLKIDFFFSSIQASMKLGDFKKSRDFLVRAGRLAPGNQEIRLELQKLDRWVYIEYYTYYVKIYK